MRIDLVATEAQLLLQKMSVVWSNMVSEVSYRVVCNCCVIVVVDEFIWSNMVTEDSYS